MLADLEILVYIACKNLKYKASNQQNYKDTKIACEARVRRTGADGAEPRGGYMTI